MYRLILDLVLLITAEGGTNLLKCQSLGVNSIGKILIIRSRLIGISFGTASIKVIKIDCNDWHLLSTASHPHPELTSVSRGKTRLDHFSSCVLFFETPICFHANGMLQIYFVHVLIFILFLPSNSSHDKSPTQLNYDRITFRRFGAVWSYKGFVLL